MLIRLLLVVALLQFINAEVEHKFSDKDHYRVCLNFKFYRILNYIKQL